MKELSIEEKARAYDELFVKTKQIYNKENDVLILHTIEDLFPELKENEDERISREIRDFICWATDRGCITKEQVEKSNSWLAWLEKQGETTSTEDFGEFINILSKQFPEVSFAKLSRIAVRVKKWLEKQGKQKSISCGEDDEKIINFLRKCVQQPMGTDFLGDIRKTDVLDWLEKQASPVLSNSSNNGKNEQTHPDIEDAIKEVEEKAKAFTKVHKGESSDDILAQMRGKQKPAWSEEDEEMYSIVFEEYKNRQHYSHSSLKSRDINGEILGWLKSLRDRVQPKQEWSEEDERILNGLISSLVRIGANTRTDSTSINYTFSREIHWLKSLKDRVQPTIAWNENDEVALESAATNYAQDKYLPVQTAQAFMAGVRWILTNLNTYQNEHQ